jgi:putative N6-adenine-specific DNA methylase
VKDAPLDSFFISCNPGFEEDLAVEVRECWPWLIELNGQANKSGYPEIEFEKGGILVRCALELGLQLNFFLKTANRILWRIEEFKVRDFPKLFEKVGKIQWAQYLSSGNVEWIVSASKSRLNHEKRIEQTCRDAFKKAFDKNPGAPSTPQKIYVRIHDDLCTLSLDSSGQHLHKRGWGTQKGEAPLRETLAAFLLRQMMAGSVPGMLTQTTLIDPLCGSGTLLLEAAGLWQPHFERPFAFQNWKHTPKIFKTPLWKKNYKLLSSETPFKSYRGYDINEKVLTAAKENLKDFLAKTSVQKIDIELIKENLFSGQKQNLGKCWCISNPPYGERLYVQGQENFSYEDLITRMAEKWTPEKIGILLPKKTQVRQLQPPKGYEKKSEISFSNGGLEVLFLVFAAKL